MAETAQPHGDDKSVVASLVYTADTGEKPSTGATSSGENLAWHKGERQGHEFTIHDARALKETSIEVEGFQYLRHPTAVEDFFDADEVKRVYYPETEALVKQVSGCNRVLVFDHTVRTGDEEEREAKNVRAPVLAVHNDYTEWSGPQRVRDLLPDEADELLKHRVAVIQTWRPIGKPIRRSPLAICDARSLRPADLIAADRKYENRVGEIYQIAFNPAHEWYYLSEMTRDEVVVFKCYDSETDGRARFTAHSSFEWAASPDAPARQSIEMRTLAFWAPS